MALGSEGAPEGIGVVDPGLAPVGGGVRRAPVLGCMCVKTTRL